MGKTVRKGSKLKDFKEVRDGSRTRCSRSCENNGGCSYCEGNRRHNYLKNKIKKQDLNKLIWDEEELD